LLLVLILGVFSYAVPAEAVALSSLLSPSFYEIDSSSYFASPLTGVIQESYWTSEDFLSPTDKPDNTLTTIPTSLFNDDDDDGVSDNDTTAGILFAIVLSVAAGVILVLIVLAFLFYFCYSSSWTRIIRGYDKPTGDMDADMAELDELDNYGIPAEASDL